MNKFPAAAKLSKIMGSKGKNKILFAVMNCMDGMGDEIIRMTLLQRINKAYPKADIVIFTKYKFLYEKTPFVHIKNIEDFENEKDSSVDIILDHRANHMFKDSSHSKFNLLKRNGLYIKTAGDGTNHHLIREVFFDNRYYVKDGIYSKGNFLEETNAYEPIMRLGNELKLPLTLSSSIYLGDVNYNKWIIKRIEKKGGWFSKKGGYILFNPYAKITNKGYTHDTTILKDLLHLLSKNKLLVLAVFYKKNVPSVKKILKKLDSKQKSNTQVVYFFHKKEIDAKYFIAHAKKVYTVEGGIMHLTYALNRPYTIILNKGSGSAKWFPPFTKKKDIKLAGKIQNPLN